MENGWKRGPLPKDTYGWGAVVTIDLATVENVLEGEYMGGFMFADFKGDHAVLPMHDGDRVDPEKVAFYNNDIQLPIKIGEAVQTEGE